jgi:hypothetical protein
MCIVKLQKNSHTTHLNDLHSYTMNTGLEAPEEESLATAMGWEEATACTRRAEAQGLCTQLRSKILHCGR